MSFLALASCVLVASPQAVDRPTGLNISSPFGQRVDPLGAGVRMHRGIDIAGAQDSPVLAAAPGVVRHAGPRGGYGRLVEIEHFDGTRTRYAHLAAATVRVGDRVEQGTRIARMGSTGRATGTHLHFEFMVDGRAVDPTSCFGPPRPKRDARPTLGARPAQSFEQPAHRSAFALARAPSLTDGSALPGGLDATARVAQ